MAKVNGEPVVAIVDTGSAKVVISEGYFERLGLKEDDEVEYTIASATSTNKKLRKVFGFEIAVGKNRRCISAIVLEGLHFEVSWV